MRIKPAMRGDYRVRFKRVAFLVLVALVTGCFWGDSPEGTYVLRSVNGLSLPYTRYDSSSGRETGYVVFYYDSLTFSGSTYRQSTSYTIGDKINGSSGGITIQTATFSVSGSTVVLHPSASSSFGVDVSGSVDGKKLVLVKKGATWEYRK